MSFLPAELLPISSEEQLKIESFYRSFGTSLYTANTGMYIMYIRCSLLTYCFIIILSLYLNLSPIIKIISYFYIKNLNLSAAIIIIGLRFNII